MPDLSQEPKSGPDRSADDLSPVARFGSTLLVAFVFLTALPFSKVMRNEWPLPALAQGAWAFPIVGILVGLLGAVTFWLATIIGLGPWVSAFCAVGAQLFVTGALHEDGLADVADGFGGGFDRSQKLVIMRDSRIGTFGAAALIMTLGLRTAALATLADPVMAAGALIAAGTFSRALMTVPMRWLPMARPDGLAASAGRPSRVNFGGALIIGAGVTLPFLACSGGLAGIAGLLAAAMICGLVSWLALRQIGGQTGDVLGAVQQAAEITLLLAMMAIVAL